MYKLIIVDDDPWVREWLVKHIDWEEHGFSEIYDAANGYYALKIIEEKNPNIVLTDIKMDRMDGLELLKSVREKYPETRVILLSGYNEFEYARSAIKNGAVDYLLKPVEEKELLSLIKRILKEIEREKELKERENKITEQLEQSIPIMKEKLIKELISGNVPEYDFLKGELASPDSYLEFSVFYIIIIEVDNWNSLSKASGPEGIMRIKSAVKNAVEEYLNERGKCISFFEKHRLIAGFNPKSHDAAEDIKGIGPEVERKTGNTVSVGVSREKREMAQAHQAYAEALEALKGKFYMGRNQVFFSNSLETANRENAFEIKKKEQLLNAVGVGNYEKVKGLIDELVLEICKKKFSYDLLQLVLMRFIGILDEALEKAGINRETAFINYLDINIRLEEFETAEDFKEWLLSAFSIGINIIHGSGGKRNRKIIEDSIKYINSNFQADISLDDVARVLYVNPTYLSRLFKNETGETFTHYLMKVRIEKAKKLLKDSYLKIYEISEQVGYRNERYFSRIFKDFEGITPNEFRERTPGI